MAVAGRHPSFFDAARLAAFAMTDFFTFALTYLPYVAKGIIITAELTAPNITNLPPASALFMSSAR